ncbi:MAG: N-acetyl-gamma-glutamyl-phosphate reductase [Magnetococcales bacterium]|nr:N-acetyl-gamma-glutamyl-phosphate reductase [Magnetococcales bacterium]
MVVRVGILGASGYTGGELVRILSGHPQAEVTLVTSQRFAGQALSEIYPQLQGVAGPDGTPLTCRKLNASEAAEMCDVAFCALPHVTSMGVVPEMIEAGVKVVDLSADFRLNNAETYAEWYGTEHTAPELLHEAAYGLPELNREALKKARLVANPGCYPTSILLGLAPMLKEGVVDLEALVSDSKSGASGAGRAPSQATLYCEVAEGFKSYKTIGHRHTPEIEQEIGRLVGQDDVKVRFTPHLIPQSRGILSTLYVRTGEDGRDAKQWRQVYEAFYADKPFVRVLPEGRLPATNHVRGSNFCDVAITHDPRTGWFVVLSAIDNVMKGASGQAVQNMNLMLGMEEGLALGAFPLFP